MEIQELRGNKVPFPLKTAWGNGTLIPVLLFEAMGTALLIIAFNWSNADAGAIAITLFASIIIFGQVSGGHFNPFVTIGVLVRELMNGRFNQILYSILIIVSQLIGATLGAFFVDLTLSTTPGEKFDRNVAGLAMLCPPGSQKYVNSVRTRSACKLSIVDGFCGDEQIVEEYDLRPVWCDPSDNTRIIVFGEIIGTAFLVALVLNIKFSTKSNEGIIQALSISLCLFAMAHVSLLTSGGCLNLAIEIVQSVFQSNVFFKNIDLNNTEYPLLPLVKYKIPRDGMGNIIFPDGKNMVNPVKMTTEEIQQTYSNYYDVSTKSLIYYIIGGLIGAVLGGVKATFNEYEYKNAKRKANEAERKENGFYKLDREESDKQIGIN